MRVTIDLMKKSTQIIDLSNVINPRVGDDDLLLPLHIIYGDNQTDMRGKDVEFLSNDPNKKNIYIAGTCNTNTPGDNLYTGDLTFRFPAGTFKADGTYDPDKTMFRIVDKETQKVISSVNVKITVMKNSIEFDFDPDKSSYDSRAETMLQDFHDKGQAMLDDIKSLNDQAKSNVSGDTAATAKEAKQQADTNAGDISDLKGEVAGARGRFADLPGREDAQDTAISQKETIVNANANYVALQQKDAQQDAIIATKAQIDQFTTFSKQTLERLGSIDAQPKYYDTVDAMKAANPNGTNELCETVNDGHRWLYINGAWQDCGAVTDNAFKAARDASQDVLYGQSILDWQKNASSGSIVQATEDFAQYQDKPIMHLHSVQADDYVFLKSQVTEVKASKISVQCPVMLRNAQAPWIGFIEINQFAPEDDPINGTNWRSNSIRLGFNSQDLSLYQFGHCDLKPETNRIQVLIGINGIGDAYVGTPMINYGENYLPYTPQDLESDRQSEKKIAATEAQNLLYGSQLEDFQLSSSDGVTQAITSLAEFPGVRILHIKSDNTVYLTHFLPVENSSVALQLPVKASNATISIKRYKDFAEQNQVGNELFFNLSKDAKINKFENIKLEDTTRYIVLTVAINAGSEIYMGMPKINYGAHCIPYDFYEISSHYNEPTIIPVGDGGYDATSLIFTRNDDGSISYDTYNHHAAYANVDYNIVPITSKIISLKLNYASTDQLYIQLRFNKDPLVDDGFSSKTYTLPNTDSEAREYKIENIHVPDGATSFFVRIYPKDGTKGWFKDLTINKGVTVSQTSITTERDLMDQITIPRLYIQGDAYSYNNIHPFEYFTSKEKLGGYINYDIQGDSSRGYVKTNFKIKLFNDAEGKEKLKVKMKPTWSKDNKYNLKANWIDATQARNVVNARLIRDAVALTPLENPKQTAPILQTEGLGQIDGFPIEVYFDGNFYGLFTLNTKKSEVTFNMDSKVDTNEVISTELGAKNFTNDTKTIDGASWSTEIHDKANDTLKANLANFFKFVNTSSDDDFKAQIHNYIDVKSVITEMLFGWLSHEYDYYSKSELLATWNNGAYWYLIPYDLDSTWGLFWDGSKISLDDTLFSLDPKHPGSYIISDENKLHERIFTLFKDDFKKQGQLLRSTVWTNAAIINKFKMFIDDIPESSFRKEREQYSYIPSLKLTSFKQIQSAVIERGNELDSFLAQLS